MFNFNIILFVVIGLSLAGLLFIVYRKIGVLSNLSEEEITILERKKGIFQKIKEIDSKQHWLNFIISLEKFLRRLKIIFLKIENLLTIWIKGLRGKSQIMTQKSRDWIKQKEIKRRIPKEKNISDKEKKEVPIEINKKEDIIQSEEDDDELSISELKKPIKEEQKWIDLIVENPNNITAYKFLGLLYWKQHNYSDAKASLELAIKMGCKDKKVEEVLKELKNMRIK